MVWCLSRQLAVLAALDMLQELTCKCTKSCISTSTSVTFSGTTTRPCKSAQQASGEVRRKCTCDDQRIAAATPAHESLRTWNDCRGAAHPNSSLFPTVGVSSKARLSKLDFVSLLPGERHTPEPSGAANPTCTALGALGATGGLLPDADGVEVIEIVLAPPKLSLLPASLTLREKLCLPSATS